MFQKVLTPATSAVITPARLAEFGHFDVPEQYVPNSSPQVQTDAFTLLQVFIAAATEQVEICAQFACQPEQIQLALDFFPNTQDPRNFSQYELSDAYVSTTPWWWYGHTATDSIELVRRPVQVPVLTGTAVNVTAVSVSNNVVTVICGNSVGSPATQPIQVGDVVMLNGTAEGNVVQPQLTPSTTPFLNGVPLTVLTASSTQFTATFNNFYTLSGNGAVTPSSYTNNSDTGTARAVSNPLLVTYYDQNGVLCTWSSIFYYVQNDKVTLTVGSWWPLTDCRQDCIQITYWAGSATRPASNGLPANVVDPKLQQAIMYLANHMVQVRDIITVEPTSDIGKTLCLMLSSYRTFRLPR